MVSDPDSVSVKEFETTEENEIQIEAMVSEADMAKVIGKDGNGVNVTVTSEPSFITFCLLRIVDDMEDPQSLRDKIIRNQLLSGGRYILFDTNIDKHIKLTLDNFVTFDEEGKYISDLWGKVYNLNIIKQLKTESPSERTVRYLTIVYHEDIAEFLILPPQEKSIVRRR